MKMFQMRFTRNGEPTCTEVLLKIELDLPIERKLFILKWECERQYAAELLRQYLEKEYCDTIQKAHKDAYEQGWKDAKSKTRKKRNFFKCFRKDGRVGY